MKDEKYPNVAVILLNWNGWDDTVECLESLYRINYPNYGVVLVDNASSDESLKKIRDYSGGKLEVESKFFTYRAEDKPIKIIEYTYENEVVVEDDEQFESTLSSSNNVLHLIKNDENLGFAGGNNVGIKFALEHMEPEYVLLLNNDTVVDAEFLNELVNTGESDDKIGFIGAKTYFYSEENLLQAAGGGIVDYKHGVVNEVGSNTLDNGEFDGSVDLDYVGGACLLCKRRVMEDIGLLDSDFFMYWEDVNWCLRGQKKGYTSAYSYKSMIWHKYGASSENIFKIYYLNRNRIYVIGEHAKRNDYIYFMLFFFAYRLWYESLDYLIKHRDIKKTKCLLKGAFGGLRRQK